MKVWTKVQQYFWVTVVLWPALIIVYTLHPILLEPIF